MKKQSLLPGIVITEKAEAAQTDGSMPAPVAEAADATSNAASGRDKQADGWPPMAEMLRSLFVFEPTTPAPAPITVLGLECGAPRGLSHLSPAHAALMRAATVICGGKNLLAAFEETQDRAETDDTNPTLAQALHAGLSVEDVETAAHRDAATQKDEPAPVPPEAPAAAAMTECPEAAKLTEDSSTTATTATTVQPLASGPDVPPAKGLTARFLPLSLPLEPWLSRLSHMRAAGERVLLLADGDPLFFGIGATLVRQLGADCVRLIPAVTSLQQACARLALPWHKVINLSLHGRDDLSPLNAAVGREAPLCILTDARMTPDVLARHLLDRGVDWFRAHIFEYMGSAEETVHDLSMAETAGRTFGPVCTLILVPCDPPRRPHLGLDTAELAVEANLITKKPVRAAALSLLQIGPRHVVWDIGAGSGAVSLEACVLAHEGRVVAVERSAGRAMSIQENRRRFGAATLDVCLGQAPECLPALPDPHRVFMGGGLSGDDAADILGHVCHRLAAGGRLVVSCVLLDSFAFCRRYLEDLGWPLEIQLVQAAEARPLAADLHLTALNPVFLLAAQKPLGQN